MIGNKRRKRTKKAQTQILEQQIQQIADTQQQEEDVKV
jgi:hypothetical protein